MNILRFAGDNPILQRFAEKMDVNAQLMRTRQGEALNNAYEQRARDVQATGVEGAYRFL